MSISARFAPPSAMRRPLPPPSFHPKADLIMSRYRPIAPKPFFPPSSPSPDASHHLDSPFQCVPVAASSPPPATRTRKRRKNAASTTSADQAAASKRLATQSTSAPRKAPLWLGSAQKNVGLVNVLEDDDDAGFMERAAAASAPSHIFPFSSSSSSSSYIGRNIAELAVGSTSTAHGYTGGGCFSGMIRNIAGGLPSSSTSVLRQQNINLLPAISSDSGASSSSSLIRLLPPGAGAGACRQWRSCGGSPSDFISTSASAPPTDSLPPDRSDKKVCASEQQDQEQELSGLDEESAGDFSIDGNHDIDQKQQQQQQQCRLVTLNLLPEATSTPSRSINLEDRNDVSPLSGSSSVEEPNTKIMQEPGTASTTSDRDSVDVRQKQSRSFGMRVHDGSSSSIGDSDREERVRRRLFEHDGQLGSDACRCSSIYKNDVALVEQMYGNSPEPVALVEDCSDRRLLWANDSYGRGCMERSARLLGMAPPFIDPLGTPVPIWMGQIRRTGDGDAAALPPLVSATLWGFLKKLVVEEAADNAEAAEAAANRCFASPAAEATTSTRKSGVRRHSPASAPSCAVIAPRPVRLVGSTVILESVDHVGGGGGEEQGSMEAAKGELEEEGRPPALMTDGSGGVVWWVNTGYKRMVGQPDCGWLSWTGAGGAEAPAIAGEVRMCRSEGGVGLPERYGRVWGRARVEWGRQCMSLPCEVRRLEGGGGAAGGGRRVAALAWTFDLSAGVDLTWGVGR